MLIIQAYCRLQQSRGISAASFFKTQFQHAKNLAEKNAWFAWTLALANAHRQQEYIVRQAFGTSLATPHMAGIAAPWSLKF